jgi:hypothetical protein
MDDRDPTWLALRLALWPEVSKREHLEHMKTATARGPSVCLAISNEGSQKVLWKPQSVRRRLVDALASWAVAQGCTPTRI